MTSSERAVKGWPRWGSSGDRRTSVLGVTAYRAAFDEPRAVPGRQERRLGPAGLWVLPNPSGLNAHHQPADLARLFGELRAAAVDGGDRSS